MTETTTQRPHRRHQRRVLGGVPPPEPDDRDGLRRRPLRRPPARPLQGGAAGGDRGGPCGGRRGAGDPRGRADRRGPDHARHARARRRSRRARRGLGVYEIRAVDQIYGPQTLLAQVATFQHGRHARAARALARPPARLRAVHGREHRDPPRGSRLGPDLGPDRRRADDRPARAASSTRRSRRRSSRRCRRSPRTRTASACARSSATSCTRPTGGTSRRSRASTSRRRASSPGSCRRPTATRSTATASERWTTLDLEPRDVHQIGLDELATIDDERRAIAQRAGFGDDVDGYRAALVADPANQPASVEELVARANEDIERAGAVAPRVFGRLPRAGCKVRPVEPFKEKDAPFAYYFPPTIDGARPGIYYVNTYDLPSRALLQARLDDVPRGDPRAPLPDRPRDGAPDAQRVPAARRAARRRGLRRGLGPVRGAARRRAGPVPQRRASGWACSTPRRGAPRG